LVVIVELVSWLKRIVVSIGEVPILVLIRLIVPFSRKVLVIRLAIPLVAVVVLSSSVILVILVVLVVLIILVVLVVVVLIVLVILLVVVVAKPSVLSSIVVARVSLLIVALVTTLVVVLLSPWPSLVGVVYLLNTVVHLYYDSTELNSKLA
jgi:hypothetical protein